MRVGESGAVELASASSVARTAARPSLLRVSSCPAGRTKPLRRYLHGPNVSLGRLNYVRAPTARDVVILEGGGCRAVQRAHVIRFGDLIGIGGAAVGFFKHALILRRATEPDNRAEVQAGDATVLERGDVCSAGDKLPAGMQFSGTGLASLRQAAKQWTMP